MTALVEPPGRLLTVAEYAALGEDDQCRWELQEGNLVMSPSLSPDHMLALYALCDQLKAQVPDTAVVIPDVDIDLQLSRSDHPGTSRRPDLVVVQRGALQRVAATAVCCWPARRCWSSRSFRPGRAAPTS